jgi:predicted lipoprotein with Yx(FWY)xxD motif
MRLIRALVAVVFACVLTGSAVAADSSNAVVKVRSTSLGKILVGANGKTLYLFGLDKGTKSKCSGQCATFWPPLITTGPAKAGTGVAKAMLGTTRRSDGKLQVTYHGHPLYFFAEDKKAGQVKGEGFTGFGAKWWAVSPAGAKVAPAATTATTTTTPTTTSGGGGGGGYG